MGETLTMEKIRVYQDNTSMISHVMKGGGEPRTKCIEVH